ncbi:MAG: carboxypeptidase regulatory-like domain-containing protein [Acidobacteriota bacterium]|nr:carboxypeptidase regulatory-like domain-containing protein [Acidobacteriota bacterium]
MTVITLLFGCGHAMAQINAPATASISGKVTISGKGAVGIVVVAEVSDSPMDNRTIAKAVTDDEGNYRLTGIAAGHFAILPIARAFVVAAGDSFEHPGQTMNVSEGESVTKIDFALVRGGVITGRITDMEGHPIIGEHVNVVAKGDTSEARQISFFGGRKNQTDDRGVYRIYGLGPGSYRVSVGQAPAGSGRGFVMGMGGRPYARTFYPGVIDEAKATLIEIKEGTEVTNVDITPGKSDRGFSAAGRVVDAESDKPLAGAFIGYASVNEQNQKKSGMNFSPTITDANGQFHLEGLQPGHYTAFMVGIGQETSSYSEPTPFEISDGDVTGIEVKVRRGATIEGVAVLENNVDPAAAALLQSVSLIAYVDDEEKASSAPSYSRGSINADGSFRFTGLSPGKARISVMAFTTREKGPQLVRTELDGLEQPEGVEVTAGAHITGVRLVFAYGTGKLRGEVRFEGGVLPAGSGYGLSLIRAGSGNTGRPRFIEVDGRGHFSADNLPPGAYELTLESRAANPDFAPVKRTVSVADGSEAQVILVVNLAGK